MFNHTNYYSGTNFQQTIGNANFNPAITLGVGWKKNIFKNISSKIILDLNYLSGNSTYEFHYLYVYKWEGQLNYKLLQMRLMPEVNFKLTDKINCSIGILSSLILDKSQAKGTSTTYAYYENNQWQSYATPIVTEGKIDSYNIDLPWASNGITGAIYYQFRPSFEFFGRYIYERSFESRSMDSFKINQFAMGLNYYFK
jgi:hypothetical protein